jgi:hypothetical protein
VDENGRGDSNGSALIVFDVQGLPGQPSAGEYFAAWAVIRYHPSQLLFTLQADDEAGDRLADFGYGYYFYSSGGCPVGPLITRPGPVGLAPGIEDGYDHDDPLASRPAPPYAGTFNVGGHDPNHADPNDPDYVPFARFYLRLYGPDCGDFACHTDINSDCIIDDVQLQALLDAWGTTCCDPPYDRSVDHDINEVIDSADLQQVLDTWASNCN